MKALIVLLIPILLGIGDDDVQETKKHDKIGIKKKLKLAKKLSSEGSYHNAVQYYEDVYEDRPNNSHVVSQLAAINYSLRDYVQAEKWYAELLEIDPRNYPLSRLMYAKMLHYNGKFDEAKQEYEEFIKEYDGEDKGRYKALAKAGIAGCNMAPEAMNNPVPADVQHLQGEVNHQLTDFAPKYVGKDKILFSSLESDTAINLDLTKGKKDYYAKILTADFDGAYWRNVKRFPGPLNQEDKHVGNAVYADDGNTIYFTICEENQVLGMVCKIHKSIKRDGSWTEPIEVNELNKDGYTTTQPALGKTADGKDVIYFVSDRKGSRGGLDLWYSIMGDTKKWEKPVNLGKQINTPGDEITPFYDEKNQKLYFSSDGQPSLGGLDVLMVEGNIDNWGEVMNAGYPLNSTYDDQYLALNDDGDMGYMVSNRPGVLSPRGETCCDDIFSVDMRVEKTLFLKGYFTSKKDPQRKPIPGVEASLYLVDGKQFAYVGEYTTEENTMFYFQIEPEAAYKMNGAKEGYWPSIENIEAPAIEESDTIFKVFYIERIIKKKVKVQKVYFAFDRSIIRPDYIERMDSLYIIMMENMDFVLEIAGHTDSKGSDAYNVVLSEKRAQAAADYMVNLGIDEERLIVKGFGESKPIAPNELDGKDNPIGRAKNRRVDFKLLTPVEDTDEIELEIEYDDEGPTTID